MTILIIPQAGQIPTSVSQFSSLSATYATSSTTDVSSGSGVQITAITSRIQISAVARGQNGTAGDSAGVTLYRSILGIPPQGAAPNAADVGVRNATITSPAGGSAFDSSAQFVDSVTIGQTYYYYWAISTAGGAGSASIIGGIGVSANKTTIIVTPIP